MKKFFETIWEVLEAIGEYRAKNYQNHNWY